MGKAGDTHRYLLKARGVVGGVVGGGTAPGLVGTLTRPCELVGCSHGWRRRCGVAVGRLGHPCY